MACDLVATCGIIAAIMLAWLLLLWRHPLYRWLHCKFWCGVNRCCHFAMDHTELGGRAWHWASHADWAAHECARYTRCKARR